MAHLRQLFFSVNGGHWMRNGRASRYLKTAAKRRKIQPAIVSPQAAEPQNGSEATGAHGNHAEGAETVEGGWHPEEREHHRQERSYWRWTGLLATIAASGAVASVILSQCSLQEARLATSEARRQADAAEKTLMSVQRAAITYSGVDFKHIVTDTAGKDIIGWAVVLKFKNVGPTFATNIRMDSAHDFLKNPIPSKIVFEDLSLKNSPAGVAGQNIEFQTPPVLIPKNVMFELYGNISTAFFWGRVEYTDVFSHQHTTSYCFRAKDVQPPIVETVPMTFSQCETHTNAD